MTSHRARPWVALLATCVPLSVACGNDDAGGKNASGGTGGTGATAGMVMSVGGSAGNGAGQGGSTPMAGMGGQSGGSAASGGKAGSSTGGMGGAIAGGAGMPASGRGGGGGAGAGSGGTAAGAAGTAGASAGMGGALGGVGGMGGDAGAAGSVVAGTGGAGGGGAFTLTNPDFMNMAGCSKDMASSCAVFPRDLASYMQGPNISPELHWTGVPAGTQSFALILQDLTNGNAHWVIWNIAGTETGVAEDIDKETAMPAVPAGSQQTNATFANSTTMDGYFGPGSSCNVYEFLLYALSVPKFTPTSTTDANAVRTALEAADSMVLGTASLRGRQNYNNMCN